MEKNKLEKIEEIVDINAFKALVINILKNKGLKNITENENVIEGEIDSGFGKQKNIFYCLVEKLGKGTDKFEEIKLAIQKKIKRGVSTIHIVSNKNITGGFEEKFRAAFPSNAIVFISAGTVLKDIEEVYPEFWNHSDQKLLQYEKQFESELNDDWQIKKIKQFKSAHEKLLKIFIEPRLLHKVGDKESSRKALQKISIEKLKDFKKPVILEGEPGIGKTRLLKQIGIEFKKANTYSKTKKFLPIFINNINLLETREAKTVDKVFIASAIKKKLADYYTESFEELCAQYKIVLLIDSIDEFSKDHQKDIINGIKDFCSEDFYIFIGTRYQDYALISGIEHLGECEEIIVEKFNDTQIKTFLKLYFKNDMVKAEGLIDSLRENSIIQKLPITPLNLSLISILYEENNFEIPSTITDIYDNFSSLLLGRIMVDSRLDFFNVNIRERILSVYALELLMRGERNYMTREEFNSFFEIFFAPIKGTIDLKMLPEALDFIIDNTGILVCQDGKYVKFLHESYMEYYASREIFYYRRGIQATPSDKEADLIPLDNDPSLSKGKDMEAMMIENFLEITWQYTAIFYAGRTKQMEDFLRKIIARTSKSNIVVDHYKSITGLGYLIQALYMTDDKLRSKAVNSSLEHMVEIYEWMKKEGAEDKFFFKNISMPLVAVINTMYFFEYHNSLTIRGPIELSFDELFNNVNTTNEDGVKEFDHSIGYKLFTLALTLASSRINDLERLKKLIYETPMLNDPMFEKLLDFGVSIAGNKELHDIKDELKKVISHKVQQYEIEKFSKDKKEVFFSTPIGKLRYTNFDKIHANRKARLLTEGKTDAIIIEHAYSILTGDKIPYFETVPIHVDKGGANELAKALNEGAKIKTEGKIIIGLFDNDAKGIREFKGTLKPDKFDFYDGSKRIKKHKESEIFGLKLPVPTEMQHYINDDDVFNFFSIEHYFPMELLKENKVIEETKIPNVYKVNDGAKSTFANKVKSITDQETFRHFLILFKQIDHICGVDSSNIYEID